jgi:hypothetical protein
MIVYDFVHVECLRVLLHCCFVFLAATSPLMRATADGPVSNVVDLFDGARMSWSTAQLSVARYYLAAASVGNVALFAGGCGSASLCEKGVKGWRFSMIACVLSVCACCCIVVMFAMRPLSLMYATADFAASDAVDLYNGETGLWSTAQLSVARSELAAASVGNVVLFAGGCLTPIPVGALLCREDWGWCVFMVGAC